MIKPHLWSGIEFFSGGQESRCHDWTTTFQKHVPHHVLNRQPVGIRYMTQGAQPSALWQLRGLGDGREGTHVCLWLIDVDVPAQYYKAIRRKWQPTPVLLPGKSHGWRSTVGYNPWGCKESDMTEWLQKLKKKKKPVLGYQLRSLVDGFSGSVPFWLHLMSV